MRLILPAHNVPAGHASHGFFLAERASFRILSGRYKNNYRFVSHSTIFLPEKDHGQYAHNIFTFFIH
ncbi:Ferrichrome-iron receptor precursor [Erwinia sp. Ejp617]|nr:hypothetical protein [Erwinia sp. Ejp617]ADP09915.1 Ferrichrome-iron receptor precursor [Erwinia sp. Ejp617]